MTMCYKTGMSPAHFAIQVTFLFEAEGNHLYIESKL